MMKFRIFGIAGAAILALALNGCGSSSDTSDTMEEMPAPMPTDLESAEMELSTAEAALTAAEADTATTDAMLLVAQEGVEDAANALLELHAADADTAHGVVAAVRTKIAAIEAAIVVTEGRIAAAAVAAAATAKEIADARTALTAAGAAMAALDADATNAEKLAAQKMVLAAAEAVVEAAGTGATDADTEAVTTAMAAVYSTSDRITTADSIARAMAIIVNADDNATDSLAGYMKKPFHSGEDGTDYDVAVDKSVTVTVTDPKGTVGYAADDVELGAGATPGDVDGWSEDGFERDSEYVAVYNDRKAAKSQPFFKILNNGGKYPHIEVDTVDLDNDPDTGYMEREALDAVEPADGTSDDEVAAQKARYALWKSSAFVPSSAPNVDEVHTFIANSDVEGTFDGVPGTYTCQVGDPVAACTVTVNSKGNVTGDTGDWAFTPSAGALAAVVTNPDGDYLTFGYWLQTTEGDDGTSSYKFQAFSSGSMPYGVSDDTDDTATVGERMAAVKGAATYNGAAAGLYVQKQLNSDGTFDEAVDSATNGAFTADATLMANFGGLNVPTTKQFTISGNVMNFESDGDDDLSAWSVTLMEADFSGGRDTDAATFGGPGEAHTNAFNDLTEGTAGLDHGQWRGMFYGPSTAVADQNDDEDVLDDGEGRPYPTGVAGEFNAHFNNGHVHGAFGATKE